METIALHDKGILDRPTWQIWAILIEMLIVMISMVAIVVIPVLRIHTYRQEIAYYQQNYVQRQDWMNTVNTPLAELQIGLLDGKFVAVAPRHCFEPGMVIRPDCRSQAIVLPITP